MEIVLVKDSIKLMNSWIPTIIQGIIANLLTGVVASLMGLINIKYALPILGYLAIALLLFFLYFYSMQIIFKKDNEQKKELMKNIEQENKKDKEANRADREENRKDREANRIFREDEHKLMVDMSKQNQEFFDYVKNSLKDNETQQNQ